MTNQKEGPDSAATLSGPPETDGCLQQDNTTGTGETSTITVRVQRDPSTGRFASSKGGTTRLAKPAAVPAMTKKEALKILEESGYVINKQTFPEDRTVHVDIGSLSGRDFKVGLVSDPHFCSKFAQRTCIELAYEYFEHEGINTVINAGDLTTGHRVYRGQDFEVAISGADEQMNYTIDKYPKRRGIKTIVLAGNHDASFQVNEGINVVKHICDARADLQYAGMFSADVKIGDADTGEELTFGIIHPKGNGAYARSYRLQKIIEQLPPERKPNVLLMGHFHSNCVLPQYRNVCGIMLGCMESQTPFERQLGLYPECGWGVLEFRCNAQGAVRYRYEWNPYYVMKENDY